MKLRNTLSGKNEAVLKNDKAITFYSCGLTVYSQPHIGNWVAYIYWDLLQRTLTASGYDVVRVQNITDVGHLTDDGDAGEDKMQKGALKEGKTAWDVAEKYIEIADQEAYQILGLIRPTHMPRATEYISEQISFVEKLEADGYTYTIDDGVYFDTSKLKDYGKLARLDIKGLQFGARVADTGKKNPTDFALWKFSPSDQKRDMEWESPWGKGFPGWHLECSVMARELLGDTIDIHSGGIDHIPVHHTNEIAQTEAVTGTQFAKLWIHANHMKVNGTKMSKSLGNIYTLDDIVQKGFDVEAFKLLVLSKHYATEGNFTWEILESAQNRLDRWKNVAALRWQTHDTIEDDDDKDHSHDLNGTLLAAPHAALEKLQSDLNSPEAIATIERSFDTLEKTDISHIQNHSLDELLDWVQNVLGVRILDITPDIDEATKRLLVERKRAREAKDWQRSDAIRNELRSAGITINDSTDSQIWQYN